MVKKVDVTFTEIGSKASFTSISVDAAIQKPRVSTAFSEPRAQVTALQIDADVVYRLISGSISWVDVQASELVLDPDTLNRYFRDGDEVELLDQLALQTNKVSLDSIGFTDRQVADVIKAIEDQVAVTDSLSIVLVIQRSFSDLYALSDVSDIAIFKPVINSVAVTDVLSFTARLEKLEAISVTDVATLAQDKIATDSFSLGDVFEREATFRRSFTDSFALDDAATVDSFAKDTQSAKANVFGFVDTQIFSVGKGLSDGLAISDQLALATAQAVSDAVLLSEDVAIDLISTTSAVLNTSALNTFTLNS